MFDELDTVIEQKVQDEREACARVIEARIEDIKADPSYDPESDWAGIDMLLKLAATIRAHSYS